MNISDFISEAEFNEIMQRAADKEPFKFERSVKVKGNWYRFKVRCDFDYQNKYNIWPHFDYNYKDEKYGRQIGGGSLIIDLSDWEKFKRGFEKNLKRYPDYSEPAQISFFRD